MGKHTLSILVHAESGVGKSWLGATAPYPRLIIDLEGRARYAPAYNKVWWDPKAGPPPVADGTWDTCVVTVTDYETMHVIYQWLRAGAGHHQFRSVVIDSVMEAQKRCIDIVAGTAQLQQGDWGELLRKMEALIRSFRDLNLLPTNPVEVVVYLTGSICVNNEWRPLLQGALKDTFAYYPDVCGYMFMNPQPDGSPPQRSLLVKKTPGFVAKDGTNMLVSAYPSGIIPVPDNQPNLESMWKLLEQQTVAPSDAKPPGFVEPTTHQEVPAA